MVVSSVSSSGSKFRSSSKYPKEYPDPWAFSRLAVVRAPLPYFSPTFTVSLTTAEAEVVERAKKSRHIAVARKNFFIGKPPCAAGQSIVANSFCAKEKTHPKRRKRRKFPIDSQEKLCYHNAELIFARKTFVRAINT